MKVRKKAVNILGVALVYTVTSSFVALMPEDLIATKAYFSARGQVNAAINTLESEKIIYINADNFDLNKWIQTGDTNIYIINARDDGKPVVVYFEVAGNLSDLVGGINPIKVYPDEKGVELKMPIRDISLFELRDSTYSGIIKVRAFNDYINDLEIEIPEVKGNDILTMRGSQWPYGGGITLMRAQSSMLDMDLLSKYDINSYEDMVMFINEFELLEERYNELQKLYDVLLAERDQLLKEKEELMKNNEALSVEKEQLLAEIEKIQDEKDKLAQSYDSLYQEVERLRNHTCPSVPTGGAAAPAQPTNPTPSEPIPADPVLTNQTPIDPTPTDPTPADPAPADTDPTSPEPADPVPTDPVPTDQVPADSVPTDPVPTDQDQADVGGEEEDRSDGDSEPDNIDVIDNGRDEEDRTDRIIDDAGDDFLPEDTEAEPTGDIISSVIKDMAEKLQKYI